MRRNYKLLWIINKLSEIHLDLDLENAETGGEVMSIPKLTLAEFSELYDW